MKFADAKKQAHEILNGRIIVGHSLQHDFKALEYVDIDKSKIRDLVKFKKYQNSVEVANKLARVSAAPQQTVLRVNHGAKSLKKLSKEFLGVIIQEGEHSSVVDARASLALYRIAEQEWENFAR
mmetsp:Transcript_11698/g.17753  ORF Transcript_11698/g.17753 Transcript_11698/m.17753 type:complete len:124 (-) Transcript_11698:150-521(-)